MHFVAFCCIFPVIVKFKDLPDHVAQGKTGKRMDMRLRGFSLCAISRHFLVTANAGGVQSHMDSVAHVFLFVKSGKALLMSGGCRGLFSEESLMQAEPAHRGMKMCEERRRATTRVAPTTGLPGLIFVPMTVRRGRIVAASPFCLPLSARRGRDTERGFLQLLRSLSKSRGAVHGSIGSPRTVYADFASTLLAERVPPHKESGRSRRDRPLVQFKAS